MTDIKSMLARMAGGGSGSGDGGDGGGPSQKSSKGTATANTIEAIYQKKSQLEHILLRPDTYIGSVEKTIELMWVYDNAQNIMVQNQVEYVPGLYKIFDEILVNAADNKQRDKTMNCIKIDIDQEINTISIWNNGKGIPVVMHKDENMFVPTMIFGHLLTSSNYNDEEEKVTGGRNGYGAKLCNIFSTKFTVETASKEYKRQFKQTWANNMTKTTEPKIKDFFGDDYTRVTFSPDLTKFKMDKLDDGIVSLMTRRAYDVAASTRGVKVILNGKTLPIKTFKDYIDLYIKGKEDECGNNLKVIYESPNDRWEVAVTLSDRGFQQMSFVNSIATTKGGRHVDYVVDMIIKQLIEILKKKNKGGINIKPFQVKNHLWIFINCLIVNPAFDSQTKENMTLQAKSFGSKCTLSEKFYTQVTKSGIIESVLSWAKFKAQNELQKTSGKKQSKLRGIPKLEDANEAGTKNSLKCTLILTEGDSAKSLAVSGLSVIGRDYYGVFPLRGKLLNVREATHKQILENQEINNLIKILGLQYKKKYNTDDDMKTLRYGKVMIMTDQDQDGSHIKGLLINFIHYNWPELLRRDFLEEFITPIVKARKKKQVLSFYSLPELEEWKANTPNHHTYTIKYYKGLGTSTSVEAKEYFMNMTRHRIRFEYNGNEDDEAIVLAFSKKHIEHRKEWLTNFMVESRRRKELGLAERYLYMKNTKSVSFKDFVNLELVLFSNADNIRSIPSLVDGLKPGQRKVMFTCFKRNDKREVKVAQLAGSVAEMSAYHHGEQSLCMTIVNLAQNFVGSNNINLLEPRGQFGTRLTGGKDSASPRYIFTKMSPLTRLIFHPNDDQLLKHEYDDNKKIEPIWYIPIIPMVLVNGADGIGTGWMTKIPNYNPREIITNIKKMLSNQEPTNMNPWYKNFIGNIEDCGNRYVISGEILITGNEQIDITELPIGTWTQTYKENVLEPLLNGNEKTKAIINDIKEYNTDTTVRFIIKLLPGQMTNLTTEGFHKVFKLQNVVSTTSMCVFDELGCIRRFDTVGDILKEYYKLRLLYYQKRKEYLEGMLEAEADRLSNQARFILEKCQGKLIVENKKRKTIIDELIDRGYSPDPVKTWQEKNKSEDDDDDNNEEEIPEEGGEDEGEDDDDAVEQKKKSGSKKQPVESEKTLSDVKKFDYLLGMSMWMLTEEKKNELLRQRDNKLAELDVLRRKTKEDLWREDLDILLEKLDEVEEKERKEEASVTTTKKTSKKQMTLTAPSAGKRIVPIITDDLKKRIQTATKAKEKTKKNDAKKDDIEEEDEYDSMVNNMKPLKEKIKRLSDTEKKLKAKGGKDGMKQTKLNFKTNGKANSSPKKRGKKKDGSDSEISDDDFIDDDSPNISPVVKERVLSRRAATKTTKYNENDDDDEDRFSSDSDVLLLDNDAVKEHDIKQDILINNSDSEDDVIKSPPPRQHETSEDMFDSLVGRKKQDEPQKTVKRKIQESQSDDDDNNIDKKEEKKKNTKEKKKMKFDDNDDDDDNGNNKPKGRKKKKGFVDDDDDNDDDDDDFNIGKSKSKSVKKTKKNPNNNDEEGLNFGKPKPKARKKAKKKQSDDDDFDDDDFDIPKSTNRKKKNDINGKSSKIDDDDDDDDGLPLNVKPTRVARNVKKTNYVIDDSSDESN